MLSNRQENILKLIVEHYTKLVKPVGSKLICDTLKCSSATIRNEMVELENKGLLEKTHTSSGRVPSEKGYRYYVDHLMEAKELSGEDMLKLQIIFNNHQLELNDCISKSLQVISEMTNYTTIVLGGNSHDHLLKQIEVVPIDDENVIVIIVTDKGKVEHKTIKLENVSLDEVKKTVNLINSLIVGTPIDEISAKLEFEVKPIIGKYVNQHEKLYNAFYHVFSDFTVPDVNVMGRNKFLDHQEFSNIDKIKTIFSKFEDQDILKEIREETSDGESNIKVYIGKENNIDEDVTVIKTRYKTPTEEGTIAIVGPKRMEYDRVSALLDFIRVNIER